MNTTAISQQTRTAFCRTCPPPEEVTRMLQRLEFHLAFSLPANHTWGARDVPPLPAQYHYEDASGTCIEYLAGVDHPCLDDDEDEEHEARTRPVRHFPPHASRFWLTPGGQELATRRAGRVLAEAFALRWLTRPMETDQEADIPLRQRI